MPFANEHACRLRDPGDFEKGSFRRGQRSHDGKNYSVIMGRLKGKDSMTDQAFRYPKDTWGVSQARTHCSGHDGILFEPARSDREARMFQALAGGQLRREKLEGREHIVVPVVALVEGVIHASNSATPELVLAEEFGRVPPAWDGRPVMMDHPELHGEKTSANQPEVLAKWRIGFIFNTRVEDLKLKLEAWIDPERIKEVGEDAERLLARIESGDERVEVSVGVFVETESRSGEFHGKRFLAVWRDVLPDHLAMLPEGTVGACSIDMGCGAPRAAAAKGDDMLLRFAGSVPKNPSGHKMAPRGEAWSAPTLSDFTDGGWDDLSDSEKNKIATHFAWAAELPPESFGSLKFPHHRASDGAVVFRGCSAAMGRMGQSNIPDADMEKVRSHLQAHLDDFEQQRNAASGGTMKRMVEMFERFMAHFRPAAEDDAPSEGGTSDVDLRAMLEQALRAIVPAFLGVVEAFPTEGLVVYATAPEEEMLFWRRGFSVVGDKVKLDEGEVQVQQKVIYEPVTAAAATSSCGCGARLAKDAPAGEKKETDMVKKERVAAIIASGKTCFTSASASVLEQLSDAELEALEKHVKAASETPAPVADEKKEETPTTPAAPAAEEPLTEAKVLAAFPDLKKIVDDHRTAETTKKTTLVTQLKTAQSAFSETELNAMPVDQLEKLSKAMARPDYTGAGAPRVAASTDSNAIPPTPDMGERIRAARGVQDKKSAN